MQKIPNVHLNIYGKYDPSYKLLLEDLVVQKKLDGIVSLNGYISPEEIVTVVSESDFGIVPYISDPFIDLALSTKTFEYIKMSCPIVASRIPSTTSLFDDNCIWYFESGDAAGLANQIFMAINNPQLRQDKVLSSKKVYEKYNWSVMSDRYQKLITSLVV